MKQLILIFFSLILLNSKNALAGALVRIDNCSNAILCQTLLNPILSSFPQVDSTSFGTEMGNAANFAQKGLASDYTDNLSIFSLGGSIGLGSSLADQQEASTNATSSFSLPGIGIAVGANFGMKATFLPVVFLNPENIYFNFFTYELPNSGKAYAKTTSFGVHLQYILTKKSSSSYLFSLGNTLLTTGLEYNSLTFSFSDTINTVASGATFSGSYSIGAESSIFSVPIEISNNIRFLYFFNFFYGVGVDLNFGSSAPITNSNLSLSGGGLTGTPVIDLGVSSGPDLFSARYFYGLQVNLWALKLYFQSNSGISGNLTSSIIGLRFTM